MLTVGRDIPAHDFGDGCGLVFRERDLQPGERMIGDVQAQHFALEGEFVPLGPLGAVGNMFGLGGFIPQAVEVEPDLSVRLSTLLTGGAIDGRLMDLCEGSARRSQGVERSGLDERLDRALIRHLQRHLAQEVVEGGETALLCASPGDRLDYVETDVAHSAETEPHVSSGALCRNGSEVDG